MNLLRKLRHIPDPLLQESKDYLANIVAAGGGIKMETLASCDRFIRSCMAAGVWNKLIEVYPICGNDLTTALVKLKYATNPLMTGVNFVDADYTERGANGGLAGDAATKYINTNATLNAVIGGTGHMSAYIRDIETATPRYWMGGGTAGDFYLLGMVASNPNCYWGGTAQTATDLNPATIGLYQANRSSTTQLDLFLNGVLRSTNNNAVAPAQGAQNIFLHCRNANGAASNFTSKRFSFFSIGASMTAAERIALYNAVQILQANLQRNV